MYIDTEGSTAHGIFFDTPTQTTGSLFYVANANTLTTGSMARLYSNSSSTSTRALVDIRNDHPSATGATALQIDQDANAYGIKIDSEATTVPSIYIDQPATTTGNVLQVYGANALTSGTIMALHSIYRTRQCFCIWCYGYRGTSKRNQQRYID